MADGGWTRYKLQRKIFSIGEDFWIENDRGESVFKVDGKALSLREKFVLEDQGGAELVSVEKKLIALQPTMKIERQGQLYATVTKALFTIFHQHYTIGSRVVRPTRRMATSPTTSTRSATTASRWPRSRGSGSRFAMLMESRSRRAWTRR